MYGERRRGRGRTKRFGWGVTREKARDKLEELRTEHLLDQALCGFGFGIARRC